LGKSKTGYAKVSLKRELTEIIDQFIREYPEYGFRSLAQFMEDAARRRAEDLHVFELTPRFSLSQISPDQVTIEDKKLRRLVDVHRKQNGLWCQYCGKPDCEHAQFALTLGITKAPGKKQTAQVLANPGPKPKKKP